jgi:GR25 family glycosyltransferase involved in LPS biosynthesis
MVHKYNNAYHIISVNDNRKKNIDNIKEVFGKNPEPIKSFNSSNKMDIETFKLQYPKFELTEYLNYSIYPTQPNRKLGEIGIWMSNFHAWNYIVDNDIESLLILEDDVFMDETVLNGIKTLAPGSDFLIFGHWAEAVYVSNKAAKGFVESSFNDGFQRMPIDEYLMMHVRLSGMTGVKCGKLPITFQLVEQYGSDIQDSGESL